MVFKGQTVDYGRYAPNPKSLLNITVPPNVVAIVAMPSFLIALYAIYTSWDKTPFVNLFIVMLFLGHYFNRYGYFKFLGGAGHL